MALLFSTVCGFGCLPFGIVALACFICSHVVDIVGGLDVFDSSKFLSYSFVFVASLPALFVRFADLLGYLGQVSFDLIVLLSRLPHYLLAAY